MKMCLESILRHPIRKAMLLGLFLSVGISAYLSRLNFNLWLFSLLYCGAFIAFPLALGVYNLLFLLLPPGETKRENEGRTLEWVTLILGGLYSLLWMELLPENYAFHKDWQEQLYNAEKHTPVFTEAQPTVIVLFLLCLAGYLILRIRRKKRLPPLLFTLCIGSLYLGIALSLVCLIQLIKNDLAVPFYLLNVVLILLKVIKEVALDYRGFFSSEEGERLHPLRRLLHNSLHWPWLGLLCALPLLGIVIGILSLFGQAPDAILRAWTETADWTFSQRIPPQNIQKDMHYLCTVAAGGHKKVVKPLRVGKRHGHRVLVNRQLMVANAFEQLLQERLPRVHRLLRGAYDRYGYPIAKHIRSPYTADLIWVLMKPLEWGFLAVLYLFDEKPENRIAVQYPHTEPPTQ